MNVERRIAGQKEIFEPLRAANCRILPLSLPGCAVMLYALLTRTLLDLNVLHDRNPVAVKLSDGSIRNAYTLRFLNKRGFDRVIAVDVDGPADAQIHIVGADSGHARPADDHPRPRIRPPNCGCWSLCRSTKPREKTAPVKFRVTDIGLGEVASATDHFVTP